ncbi:unnamed protein product [Boreogadus saida]
MQSPRRPVMSLCDVIRQGRGVGLVSGVCVGFLLPPPQQKTFNNEMFTDVFYMTPPPPLRHSDTNTLLKKRTATTRRHLGCCLNECVHQLPYCRLCQKDCPPPPLPASTVSDLSTSVPLLPPAAAAPNLSSTILYSRENTL